MLGSLHPILPGVCQKCTEGTGLVGCCPEPIPFPVDPLPLAGLPKEQRISRCKLVFLIGAAGDDLQSIIRRRTLQRLRLIPRRPHPDVALFVRGHDHRHSPGDGSAQRQVFRRHHQTRRKQDEGLPGGVGLRTGLVRLLASQMARSTVPPVSLTTRIAPKFAVNRAMTKI